MAFEAKLNESQAQQVIGLIDQAIRAGGIQVARIGLPIADDLVRQADTYNQSLVEPEKKPETPPDHDAR